jgi:phthalate 4,5-dioxygenase oxygenase subunit
MLTAEENALLIRVGPGTPAGEMLRRYWIPACLSEEIAEPDGTPIRVRLLGENLVAFRDTAGTAGVTDEACPHRRASLALGRNEEGGLRCIYHGWKFGTDGRCLEMPTEPADAGFKEKIRVRAYPVREIGGMIWIYMGPAEHQPAFPEYDWLTAPAHTRTILKEGQWSNYLQGLEGSIDSSHTWFLHRGAAPDWGKRLAISADVAPRLETEDTDYGFRYAAIRVPTENPETERYVRVTLWAMPFTAFIPRPIDPAEYTHVAIHVPIDDETTMFYGIWVSQDGSSIDTAAWRAKQAAVPGVDLDARWMRKAKPENWFFQDRAAMKAGDWAGMAGVPNQDMAVQESMGPIVDRTQEHLGTSDVAVIRMRRRMLESLRRFRAGEPPIGLDVPVRYDRMRSEQRIIPIGTPWQTVGAFAGEYAGEGSLVP